ncbi:ribonuclease PH [Candidatus Marinamargulisbacteria bacterium SCGC AG-410-N11]|nr:ribonuclease PH [Candidatus Marinamargulisbacteria bacterium SCGC AG-410-N11]
MRVDGRNLNQVRDIQIEKNYTRNSPGSVLISYGNTRVICMANFEEKVPFFLKGKEEGWLTAEYSMLPGATMPRSSREVKRGKPTGRTSEIQRLIGRSLRAVIDFKALGEYTISIDTDVIQADGGTRTAAITGSMVALLDLVEYMVKEGYLEESPIIEKIAAVSVGKWQGQILSDLCYEEDSNAELDMNVVMTESNRIVEVQATGEQTTITRDDFNSLLDSAQDSIEQVFKSVYE